MLCDPWSWGMCVLVFCLIGLFFLVIIDLTWWRLSLMCDCVFLLVLELIIVIRICFGCFILMENSKSFKGFGTVICRAEWRRAIHVVKLILWGKYLLLWCCFLFYFWLLIALLYDGVSLLMYDFYFPIGL